MQIDLKKVKYYYINVPSQTERRKHMEQMLMRLGVEYECVEAFTSTSRLASGAMNHMRCCHLALSRSEFKPFVLLEDDCDLFTNIGVIDLPLSTDAVYLGTSKCAANFNDFYDGNARCFRVVDKYTHLLRDYNMLAAHAVLFITPRFASAYAGSMIEPANTEKAWDTVTCRLKPFFQIYTLITPIFYQTKKLGGQEEPTKHVIPEDVYNTVKGAYRIKYSSWTIFTSVYQLKEEIHRYPSSTLKELAEKAWENKYSTLKVSCGPHEFKYNEIKFDCIYVRDSSICASVEALVSYRDGMNVAFRYD